MTVPLEDEFESTTENPALVDVLRQRIDTEGAITFHDYMETVLYHPQHGYCASRAPMGREGDYLTSPEVHPIFGSLVAKQIAQFWELMGKPARFDLVEQGAGSGILARDILRWARRRAPEFAASLRYQIVDVSPALTRRQAETLAEHDVEWLDELPQGITGCLLSNELLDSFAVHRVMNRNGKLLENFVTLEDGRFAEVSRPPSTARIEEYFDRLGLLPGEDCVAEVNLQAIDWMKASARSVSNGFVLTFDYGYEAKELYAPWRRDGTLMGFYRHNPSTDPFARIGKQDMTSHVDFTTLMCEDEAHGLATSGFTTQSRFLAALGIGAGVDSVDKKSPNALEEYYSRRKAVQELIDPADLGRIRVLAQSRGIENAELIGFMEEADA
jgi:SAM-dependent MidA family methyltransferase